MLSFTRSRGHRDRQTISTFVQIASLLFYYLFRHTFSKRNARAQLCTVLSLISKTHSYFIPITETRYI